ncbi:MAG: helical backbone metal receptor [Tepidiformaceae bacterium]
MTEPARIVSLVPSLTELVFWLGAGDRLVGRTRFCEEPAGQVERVPIVGGTKNPKVQRIVDLRPDLVLANKEENRREDIEALQAAGLDVLLTDPNTVAEAVAMVEQLGALLGAEEPARQLAAATREELAPPLRGLADKGLGGEAPRVFVAIWWNPLMGLGSASYGHDLLSRAGAVNVLAARERYPEVSLEEVAALSPDLVLLPDEPFPFTSRQTPAFEAIASVRLIDGKLLWWYGPRMPSAIRQLRQLLSEVSRPA